MDTAELTALVDRLRAEPREAEWLEFKANRHEPQVLGEYLSALAHMGSGAGGRGLMAINGRSMHRRSF